jgi:hypothetical protein
MKMKMKMKKVTRKQTASLSVISASDDLWLKGVFKRQGDRRSNIEFSGGLL